MSIKRRVNYLEEWEISLIKAFLKHDTPLDDQDILPYFSRPTRSVNHRLIGKIRTGKKHNQVSTSTQAELDSFLASWPDIDPETGLSLRGDELLIKAREAMIAAVHSFNSAGLTFRAELFIVTAIIAWTYLLHSWFKREGIDYRYTKNKDGIKEFVKTPSGGDKFWELGFCLKHEKCPVGLIPKHNLNFLCDLRHEIEHRSTDKIDNTISAYLQACCINFNDAIKEWFGNQYALELRLPIALQFVTFRLDQQEILKKANNLPRHILTAMDQFNKTMTAEELNNTRFACRVYMEAKAANHASSADITATLVSQDQAADGTFMCIQREVEKKKYRAGQIVKIINDEGFKGFRLHEHTKLYQKLNAKNPTKNYGVMAVDNCWFWYDAWLVRVREECKKDTSLRVEKPSKKLEKLNERG